jgi:protein gp37
MTLPKARPPHPDWFRSIRDQCIAAEVPFFLKAFAVCDSFVGRQFI